jgi:3-deoxy-D-manno-octulosonic-acid transferase
VADIIIIGGSFFHSGGHNPIEPALAGKPMICGKSIFNNEADYIDLIKAGIIRQIDSNETLDETLNEILQSDKAMLQAIIKGQEIAQEACMRPAKAAHYIVSTIEK